MLRGFNFDLDGHFEFNSDDTSDHPWGDFVFPPVDQKMAVFLIDGKVVRFPNYKASGKEVLYFFHRDEEGKIDHIYVCDYAKELAGKEVRVETVLKLCPCCNPNPLKA